MRNPCFFFSFRDNSNSCKTITDLKGLNEFFIQNLMRSACSCEERFQIKCNCCPYYVLESRIFVDITSSLKIVYFVADGCNLHSYFKNSRVVFLYGSRHCLRLSQCRKNQDCCTSGKGTWESPQVFFIIRIKISLRVTTIFIKSNSMKSIINLHVNEIETKPREAETWIDLNSC